ncbi:CinA family protein [Aeromicrobium wangtongii]|uniref:CinA family protein n=1 Tax=Aeromicrobium wangtongii TaxID=2969247 RepID=A0ABY5M2L7_9ACTN|nr:CinA family protein [Aeromicrobium wangtongii]MCD9198409.1 CinA family protein [Aeromicrobium wangtongii]UUP12439.1 CinA family protein [Aeromicrobium wangtongii]
MTVAVDAVEALRAAGATVSTAESLTGGLVCATLVSVPGASAVVRGGVVAYAPELKTTLLGVDAALIAERGTVDAAVAAAMAVGTRDRAGATYGLSTTGVAGPDPSEGKPAGTVHIGLAGPDGVVTRLLDLAGDRDEIRTGTVDAVLSLLVARLGEESRTARG